MGNISQHFDLEEFIDPVTFKELGGRSILKIDSKLINIAELVRFYCDKAVMINNWNTGGDHKESGLRRLESKIGALHSAHKEGKAIDFRVVGMTPEQVHAIIMAHEKDFYNAGVRQMEDLSFTPSWTHLGIRGKDNTQSKIQIIKP